MDRKNVNTAGSLEIRLYRISFPAAGHEMEGEEEETNFCEILRIHHVHFRLERFFDVFFHIELINLIDTMLRIAFEECEYCAERHASIDGKFLDGHALLVKEILVRRVDKLDSCLTIELLQH